jgi:esterase/lipase
MRYLARFFQQNGFRVMAILLPGHGTQPGDLLNIRWQEWAGTLAYGVKQLNNEVDEIYLAGFSVGGALSVYHSLSDSKVRGLFLFSPALKISPKAAWANWHKFYSWLAPSSKWLSICPDRDIYKYESVTKQAVAQTWALTRELDKKIQEKTISIPVFAAASMEDTTVCTSATVELIRRARHPANRLVLYSTDAEAPVLPSIERINSIVPEQRILSFSHTSVTIPATDTHYGISGEYCSCQHYYPHDMEKYAACVEHPEQAKLGELTPKNLESGLLRRLTYNPKFEQLKDSMQRFIESLPK